MKQHKQSLQEFLDRSFARFRKLPPNHVELACDRVLDRLRKEMDRAPEALPSRVDFSQSHWRLITIAAASAIVSLVIFMHTGIDAHAVVESADGSLSRVSAEKTQVVHAGERIEAGEVLRSNAVGARIALADTSRVELRAGSEFSLERADDGVRIHLFKGGLIINAAKQLAGHLYVLTKDVAVSVVGTVFMVNAEEEGSRVAVIEGEVRVQQGKAEKTLLPGQQLSTNASMKVLPVKEELSWSQSAPEHIALLQRATSAPSAGGTARLEFGAVSIKVIAPFTVIPGGLGLACHGIDGIQRVLLTFTQGGQESVTAPQGRCVGNGVFLSTLIEFAYGIQPGYVSGGPEWALRKAFVTVDAERRGAMIRGLPGYAGPDGSAWPTVESFQIQATADDPSSATRQQLTQMLQTMLTDRFKLQFRRDRQEAPGYALVIGSKGSKLKPVSGDYEESLVPYKGKSTLANFAQTLSKILDAPVVDRTGLAGPYEYEFHMFPPPPPPPVADGGGGRGGRGGGGPLSLAERADRLSAALDEQLGLRLVPEKAVPIETLVIESVEPPTPN